jgi:predicted DNA-binding protein
MQKRTIKIKIRLNQKEADELNNRVKKSGRSREAYLREVISRNTLTYTTSPDYFSMMMALRPIGANLNKIAQKAHILNVLDTKQFDENISMFENVAKDIVNAAAQSYKFTQGESQGGKKDAE